MINDVRESFTTYPSLSSSDAPVQIKLGSGAARLQLIERAREASEDPQDEYGVQGRDGEHQDDACCAGQVVDGAHIGDDVQAADRHKVGHP